MRHRQGRLCAWLLLGLLAAAPARASYEEFSTFDVARSEEDDEFLLDHELVRSPFEWHAAFDQAASAFRSSQGCFTSGMWFIDNELKVQVPMGDTTKFIIGMRDVEDLEAHYSWTRLDARFPLPHTGGLWTVRFAPNFDKSQQDWAVQWDHGDAFKPLQVTAVFTVEDAFNKFWSARQTRVGDDAAPYLRHPYEPALGITWRGSGTTFSARGKWLTPSTKQFDTKDSTLRRQEKLWGGKGDAYLAQRIGATTAEVSFEDIQASSWAYWEQQTGDHHVFRRRWRIESSLVTDVGEHGHVALRFFYQDRVQVWRPPIANATLGVIDRMPMIESWFRGPWSLGIRVGYMKDHITVSDNGGIGGLAASEGTRPETRAFFQLQKQFGRVLLQGTEGIELDKEPYPVTFHHDKGFLQLQTTF